MENGKKYINAVANKNGETQCAFIFLRFANEDRSLGYFVKDNQKLFEFLGEPYSQDAINGACFANFFNLEKYKSDIYVFDCTEPYSKWMDAETIARQKGNLTKEIQSLSALDRILESPAYYDCDCPNGSVYNEFITEFKDGCAANGLSTSEFTFHGDEHSNRLTVSHHGTDVGCTDDECYQGITQSDVFFALENQPKYSRIEQGYCHTTNQPEI